MPAGETNDFFFGALLCELEPFAQIKKKTCTHMHTVPEVCYQLDAVAVETANSQQAKNAIRLSNK